MLPYNAEWTAWYRELKDQIWPPVSDLASEIVHVGSTSIPGMSAKPIIDIDLVAENLDDIELFKERLSTIGYVHVGNLGIEDREAFKEIGTPLHRHNLYLVQRNSPAFRNHVLLKKHLQENPESFKRYNDLKLTLADSTSSVDEYCMAKTMLILEFLEAEGVPESDIEQIRQENLS